MQLKPNSLLQGGKYRIVRFIDSGGFGCTYEAEHVMLGKKLAIKEFFVKDFCNRDEATAHVTVGTQSKKGLVNKLRQKFIDEARAICKLHHPNIVTVSDVFEENGTAYFVMDYIEGYSLRKVIDRQGKLTEKKALHYIRQVADALDYVHSNNRLHLDVKPGNIMIDSSDRAILIDFGTSKQYDEQDGENTSTLMGMTRGYAPLEQMRNNVGKFMPATDIYSLGATLYKLLTGVTPPEANEVNEEGLPPFPIGISQAIAAAVTAAMQPRRKDRPQSVNEFMALLSGGEDESTFVKLESESKSKLHPDGTDGNHEKKELPPNPPNPWGKWIMPLIVSVITVLVVILWPKERNEKPEDTVKEVSPSQYTGIINGHKYVDLGLSVMWADRNVGASSPNDYGDYFAWGEMLPKATYTEENCNTFEENFGNRDAAQANWNGSWRLPTQKEFQELIDKCLWHWTSFDGHKGYEIIGLNGNRIFLPATGRRYKTSLYDGESGFYWTSTPNKEDLSLACNFFMANGVTRLYWENRSYGLNIRPVSSK